MATELLGNEAGLRTLNLKLCERLKNRVEENKRLQEQLEAADEHKQDYIDTAGTISRYARTDICRRYNSCA